MKYTYKPVDEETIKKINLETGAITLIKLATPKQRDYIKSLREQLNLKPAKYEYLPRWKAAKLINKFQAELEAKNNQLQIL